MPREIFLLDLGPQLVAGANVIQTFLIDFEVSNYLIEYSIENMKFEQYI